MSFASLVEIKQKFQKHHEWALFSSLAEHKPNFYFLHYFGSVLKLKKKCYLKNNSTIVNYCVSKFNLSTYYYYFQITAMYDNDYVWAHFIKEPAIDGAMSRKSFWFQKLTLSDILNHQIWSGLVVQESITVSI
jgi:hypothetical protein